jgi:hypothetical protein
MSQSMLKSLAYQVDHVNDPVGGSWQRTGDPGILEFVWEIEAQKRRPYAGTQMLHGGGVDLAYPLRVASQEVVDGDARHATCA